MAAEVYPSEEKTEPFTAEEIQLRLEQTMEYETFCEAQDHNVPLDQLVIREEDHKKGLRLLLRPLTRSRSVSPCIDNCQWLDLGTDVGDPDQPTSKVLAVTQTSKDIKFPIRMSQVEEEGRPALWCELFYDPASDGLVFLNRSDIPIALARISSIHSETNFKQEIYPEEGRTLSPGTWRISIDIPVLDFRILEKRPVARHARLESARSTTPKPTSAPSQTTQSRLGKRSLSSDDHATENGVVEKKLRTDDAHKRSEDIIVFLGPKDDPLVFPYPNAPKAKEIAIPNGHALLEVQKDGIVAIPGDREMDGYKLTKREEIATTRASCVFTAEHSQVPDGVITVKVLKTGGSPSDTHPPDANYRNVIRQADVWLREYQSQEDLEHDSIVKLYGGDARYLSLYMEHVDGKDLAARNVWRDISTDKFVGSRADAVRILKDIAGALHYLHQKKRIHNDIKPANILYSQDRGAVLCDFGMSTHTTDPAAKGGTPYYVPPEFIAQKLRGTASDVWALGVTMLYVLRKIPFPDARGLRGHPKKLYWMIADLHRRPQLPRASPSAPSAVEQMQKWLTEIKEARGQLNQRDKIESLVWQMLMPNPLQRVTMGRVMNELHSDRDATPVK